MFNIQLLLLLHIFVTTAFAVDNSTRAARDPRLTVINIYSGLEEVKDLNKNRTDSMFMSSEDEDDDDDDDDDDENAVNYYNPEKHTYEPEEADEEGVLPHKGKKKHNLLYDGQMQKLAPDNSSPDKVRSKENSTDRKKSKSKPTVLKHHRRSKIFYSNADILKSDSPNDETNTNGIDNNDFDKVKVMKEFVTDRDGFWPKTYNWNSFRKVIQLINEIS